ncbi:MAG: choice-of-anchor E domain-containing protein [Phycisphaerales bacterium]|nr:choice-of-anchor E domain-containing protein [Phycisphaerales bacterium]
MRNKKQMAGVLLALASSTAFADVMTVSGSASGLAGGSPQTGTGEGETYTAKIDQFDASLGTLTGVELSINAWHEGTFDFVSNNGPGGYIVFYIDYSFEINGFGGTGGNLGLLDWVTEPTPGSPFGSGPGHFNTPFNSVPINTPITETFGTEIDLMSTYSAGDSEFSQFIGTGTLGFDIVDWAVFSLATTGESVSWVLASMAGLTVEATYTFDPIPSPGAVSLLAISGLLATRRRRSM